jgi:hypothetical protein
MESVRAILSCLCGSPESTPDFFSSAADEKLSAKPLLSPEYDSFVCAHERLAIDVVTTLLRAEKRGESLKQQLDETVGTFGWSQMLAERILKTLTGAVKEGREKMGPVFVQAYDDAVKAAESHFHKLVQDAKDHPLELVATIIITIIAFGVLVELSPFILELLGFAELGPVAGKPSLVMDGFLAIDVSNEFDGRLICFLVGIDVRGLYSSRIAFFLFPAFRYDLGTHVKRRGTRRLIGSEVALTGRFLRCSSIPLHHFFLINKTLRAIIFGAYKILTR